VTQRGEYFRLGGQPAHRDAWTDPECDALAGGFFSQTLPSMDNAYLRPRTPGFTPFQTAAGVILRTDAVIRGDIDTAADRLDAEWRRVKESTS
jgi:multiple sugar transport system substrate-binding protein